MVRDPYARWCGRGGTVRCPPIPINAPYADVGIRAVHLIRKGVALAGGLNPQGAHFGAWLLREMRGLIHEVAEGTGARIINPILARLKRACKLHRDDEAEKVRALAREILNDWTAITAFVTNPDLPATNNEAERALRDAVIARRISNGTRSEEGSAAYAAT